MTAPPNPIDWPVLLAELALMLGDDDPATGQRTPVGTPTLSDLLGVARGTLRGWLDGSEPRHADGELLLIRWSSLTGKAQTFAPRRRRSLSAAALR